MSHRLATIVTDAPLEFEVRANLRRGFKPELYDIFLRLEFSRLIERMGLTAAAENVTVENAEEVVGSCVSEIVESRERAAELLEMVGMSHRKNHRLDQMSGGEQQRIAIAIALANNPKILLADEPTGSVDVKTGAYILDMFRDINKNTGLTIVIVTHDLQLSRRVAVSAVQLPHPGALNGLNGVGQHHGAGLSRFFLQKALFQRS